MPIRVAAVRQQSHDERAHQRAQHAAFAAAQAAAADHYRGDGGQFVALAAGRLAGHQARDLDHSRQTGQRAGDGVNCGGVKTHGHAGVVGRVRIAADRKRVAPQARVLERHMHQRRRREQNPQHKRNAQQRAFGQVRIRRRNFVYRQALRDDQRQAAKDPHGAERHDERAHAQRRDHETVREIRTAFRSPVPRRCPSRCRTSPSPSRPAIQPAPGSSRPTDRCRPR